MHQALSPVARQSLADGLAEKVRELIHQGGFHAGDRLPSIADMARRFGVGHPTLREALKKLETLGVVNIRHGSGVYVGRDSNSLVITNPIFTGSATRKLLLDLIEARTPIEVTTVTLAAHHASNADLEEMRSLLQRAAEHLDDDAILSTANLAFHRAIAVASGNTVLSQVLEVLTKLFENEQRLILSIHASRQKDHGEHVEIFEAVERRDPELAAERMRTHLEGVREALLRWDSDAVPSG